MPKAENGEHQTLLPSGRWFLLTAGCLSIFGRLSPTGQILGKWPLQIPKGSPASVRQGRVHTADAPAGRPGDEESGSAARLTDCATRGLGAVGYGPPPFLPPCGRWEVRGDFSCRKENQDTDPRRQGGHVQARCAPAGAGGAPEIQLQNPSLVHPGCSIQSQFLGFVGFFFFFLFLFPVFFRAYLSCVPK